MSPAEWQRWRADYEAAPPVAVRCPICRVLKRPGERHTCTLSGGAPMPVEQRARLAQRLKRELKIDVPEEMQELLDLLTSACRRNLGVPPGIHEIRGRYHMNIGYIWSYRQGWKWTQFATFAA